MFSSVSASLLTKTRPSSLTRSTTCCGAWSGGGGGVTSVFSSGTRTTISFSISGVSTMKMISSTSTMSTSGVMLMSLRGPLPVPTSAPMATSSP